VFKDNSNSHTRQGSTNIGSFTVNNHSATTNLVAVIYADSSYSTIVDKVTINILSDGTNGRGVANHEQISTNTITQTYWHDSSSVPPKATQSGGNGAWKWQRSQK
jgi:hypothetical protein